MHKKDDETFQIRVLPKMWRGNDVQVSPEVLARGIRIPGAKYDPKQDLRRAFSKVAFMALPKDQAKSR